ncbi:hypothetical protein PhCBS80983_g03592 [Powellomyces hirtus]|uniref:COX assembly mitochondrial protein n=1 Tax=Powellomyces hirtus TaxID=109895 RepID=A0A507E3S3_9FUNG|nr:hypothetical protein PhCBS80983_g03592 [Powellomyces hirtus]
MVSLTVLSNKEEELIHNQLKKNALTKCSKLVEELVACTRSRTLTVYFACQKHQKILNECLGPYTTETERDKLREVHLATKKEWVKAGKPDNTPPRPGQQKK